MKLADVPKRALSAQATPIPVKTVYDWEKLYHIMLSKGYVIIDTDRVRITTAGSEEAVLVKQLNCYVRNAKKQPMYTKRIGATRWFCTL